MTQYRTPTRRPARATSRIEVADVGIAPDFDSAMRHSSRVRFLRWALPVVIVVGVGAYFLSANLPGANLPIDFDNVVVNGEGIVVNNPRVIRAEEGQSYEVAAERAIQPTGNPNQLRLEGVTATYEFPGGDVAHFTAPAGEYDGDAQVVTLSGGVTMTIGENVQLQLETVTVDVSNNTITTDQPFELNAGNFTVRGTNLQMTPENMRIAGAETVFTADGTTAPLPRIGIIAP
jgi:lipopolysaccharide export system protein LptC